MAARHHLSTHVLDTGLGRPAAGLTVRVYRVEGETARLLGSHETNADGRVADLLGGALERGVYRIAWDVAGYARAAGQDNAFFAEITAQVEVRDADRSYHVPLILSPHSGMTYLGS